MSDKPKRAPSKTVLTKFPEAAVPFIEEAVKRCDTDRSKFIRAAVREKARKVGVIIPAR